MADAWMSENLNTIKIAVLQEQIVSLRDQQRTHNEHAQRRFNNLEEKLDELTAILNRGRGAYAASMALAAAIGGVMIEVLNFFSHR